MSAQLRNLTGKAATGVFAGSFSKAMPHRLSILCRHDGSFTIEGLLIVESQEIDTAPCFRASSDIGTKRSCCRVSICQMNGVAGTGESCLQRLERPFYISIMSFTAAHIEIVICGDGEP